MIETTLDNFCTGTSRIPRKIFVCYSHKDRYWLECLRVHLAPIEHEGVIDLWNDTNIAPGTFWKQQIQEAIETSQAAIILVSAHLLASGFITEYELPRLLEEEATRGLHIVLVIVSYCLFKRSRLNVLQTLNAPNKPLIAMSTAQRDKTLVRVAEDLYGCLMGSSILLEKEIL